MKQSARLPSGSRNCCVSCDVVLQRGLTEPVHVSSLKIKRDKGIWWMPWHQKAMKDVALCEKFRGIESKC